MNQRHSAYRRDRSTQRATRSWWAAPASFLAILLALPASAGIPIPDDPLTTAARVAPNVLFILDDSGSMAFDYMPDTVPDTSDPDVSDRAYTRNTLSYNPAVTYQPWVRADGNRLTGGTSYTAAYGSFNLVGGTTINLGNSGSCQRFNENDNATTDEFSSGGTQVCGGVQTFYVPKDTTRTDEAYLGVGTNYYRYQILAGGSDIQRSEHGAVVATSSDGSWSGLNGNSGMQNVGSFIVPAGAIELVVTSSGGTHGDNTSANNNDGNGADLYLRRGNWPTTGTYECRSRNGANNETCEIDSPTSGTWYVGLNGASRYRNVTVNYSIITGTNSCDGSTSGSGWINCTSALPNSSRTLGQELVNYATWFSYHRTRMKSAKAGSSEAFAALDGKVRVGFRTIWDRSGSRFDIPVGDGNDGRFVDNEVDPSIPGSIATTSRSTWYSRLHGVIGYNGTPLLSALESAGEYYSGDGSSGPYGPQSGADQYYCRQNFSILTTDGYWNNDSVSLGNSDGTDGDTITGPKSQTYTYDAAAPYQDDYSNTLADVAMHYWKRDLRDDLTNNVPATAANPAFWQHMVTFGISIGLRGNKGWSSVAEVPANATWNNPMDGPSSGDADRIDDLLHASVNGRGAFVAASNPSEFADGLSGALATIAQRTSSYSNVATNSVSLESGSQAFNASYVSGIWTGLVTARAITRSGVSSTISWTSTIPAWSTRKVFTANGNDFPTNAQETALARTGGPANFEVTGLENARYIKGKPGLEARNGGTLRNRTSILGDIVGSSPAYSKDVDALFVGANDGMLHAFDAASGEEIFAYVPNILSFSALATLSRGDYAHRFFVDGPVIVSSQRQTPGKNTLVGTLGKGGKGLFALNVTKPTLGGWTAAHVYKWERSETPGSNMGLVLGKPFFAKTADGSTSVILGNGINSTSEKAVLLVLDADTGGVIREIDTGVGSIAAPNGLSAATGVFGRDGKTLAYVYAGDMLGNLWKFDLTAASPASWSVKRLFTAAVGGVPQPISSGVTVAKHPRTGKRWVFFGTGRYLTTSDADSTSTAVQSMYGIIDDDVLVARTALTPRTLSVTSATQSGYPVRAFEEKAPLPDGSKGWYINLPESGERIVQDAQVVSTFLVTASMIPTGSACDADGSGYINALDAFTGTSAGGSYFDLDGDGTTDDSTTGGQPVGSVDVGVGMPTLPNLLRGMLVVGGTGGSDLGSPLTLQPRWDRASWREIRGE